MEIIYSLLIAFSMYSNIPVPQVEWTDRRMKYAMCFFPFIGIIMGVVAVLLYRACAFIGAGRLFTTMLIVALPFFITGGIHIDGYMDTCDARHSYGDRQKKLEILKDPHIGAFSVICIAFYLIVYAGAVSEFELQEVMLLPAVYTMERAFSAVSVVNFPKAKKDGLVSTFARTASDRIVTITSIFYILISVAYIYQFDVIMFCVIFLTALLTFAWYYRIAMHEFGGITGDLAGYFLQVTERNLILVIALTKIFVWTFYR